MAMNESSQPAPTRAMRLIFEYEGNQVRLVSQQPVEMAITGSDIAKVEHPGYYVDTRDARDRTLARVPARNAFSASVEVFPRKARRADFTGRCGAAARSIHCCCPRPGRCRLL